MFVRVRVNHGERPTERGGKYRARLGSQVYVVAYLNLCDDFFNIGIISDINRLIGDSGYQFAVCDNLGVPN